MDTDSEAGSSPITRSGSELPRLLSDLALTSADTMEAVREAHRRFKLAEVDSAVSGLDSIAGLTPIHLYPLLRFERVRGDHPVFIQDDGSRPTSLTSIIDDLIERSDTQGDARQYFQRSVLRLEAAMRTLVGSIGATELPVLWNAALEHLENSLSADERDTVLGHLRDARARLAVSGSVLPFGRALPLALLERASARYSSVRTRHLQEELETLSRQARALLDVDESERPGAHSPDALEKSVGDSFGEELDFNALSALIDKSPHGPVLSEKRRYRIGFVLGVLSDQLAALRHESASHGAVNTIASPDELSDLVDLHRNRCLELVKAIQTARLEALDQYDEDLHGLQFEALTVHQLSVSDLVSLPVTPVVVNGTDIEGIESFLQACLDRVEPVKVVLTIDTPVLAHGQTGLANSVGSRLLAGGRPECAVYQVSLSDLEGVTEAFDEALAFAGPAVVCVYVGSEFGSEKFHPYLRAAAAHDARIFPSFSNNPDMGRGWAGRFSIDRNNEEGEHWPVSTIRYVDADGAEVEEEWAFTAADVMATDDHFSDAFRQIPQAHWHDDLVPLAEYMEREDRVSLVPFILMVGDDGRLVRVICSDKVIGWTDQTGGRWRSLQELGGINNSHALRLLELEKQRLEEESLIRIQEAESGLRAELEQKTGSLAEQIVSNIASGLLGSDLISVRPQGQMADPPPVVPSTDSRAPEPVPEATQVEAQLQTDETQEAEEDDELSFDEAYIETPRCTTCDECTTINPRMFAYNDNKQAYIVDASAGLFREMVQAAEKCPVKIIHTGKPLNPDEPHLDELVARAEPFR